MFNAQIPQSNYWGLANLRNLTHLQVLSLDFMPVTVAGLESLGGLIELRRLNLRHTKVTDAGLKHIKLDAAVAVGWRWRTMSSGLGAA